jgi:hypothetical protein
VHTVHSKKHGPSPDPAWAQRNHHVTCHTRATAAVSCAPIHTRQARSTWPTRVPRKALDTRRAGPARGPRRAPPTLRPEITLPPHVPPLAARPRGTRAPHRPPRAGGACSAWAAWYALGARRAALAPRTWYT